MKTFFLIAKIFPLSNRHIAEVFSTNVTYFDCFRAQFRYKENYTTSYLELKELLVTDEAVYKCEITYLEVRENCQVVQFINLTTLSK